MAKAILTLSLPAGSIRESVLGDLEELFGELLDDPGTGARGARRWYWAQALRLAVRYTVRRLSGASFKVRVTASRVREVRGDGVAGVVRRVGLSVRSLTRSPGFTLPALLILAIGMTAATTILTVVDSVVFRPLDYPESDRLVILCEDHAQLRGVCVASPGNAADLRSGSSLLSELGIARGWQFAVADDRGRQGLRGGLATGSFFRALGTRPQIGRLFGDDEVGPDNDRVLLLSHDLWVSRYGSEPSIVGSTIAVEGEPFTVVGVLPAGFEAPLLEGVQAWKPPHFGLLDADVRGWRGWRAVGRVASGTSRQAVAEELEELYRGLATVHEEINGEWRLRVRPLLDVVVGPARPAFYAFLAAAGLLLAIVCANVANLILARGLGRRRELAVRAALGAGRRSLVGEILIEGLVLAVLAGVLSVGFAAGATRLFMLIAPPEMPRLDEVALDGRILGFAAVISMLATAAFSVLPALRVTAWDLAQTIKSGSGSGDTRSSDRLRRGLVVAELALSMVLLSSAALLLRSFERYLAWDPGFDRERLVAVTAFFPPEKYVARADLVPVYREAEIRLGALPGVVATSSASAGPLFGGGDGETPFTTGDWDGTGELPSGRWYDVGPGYFATLGLSLVRGREFVESDDRGSSAVVIVNETLARMAWPGQEAVGKSLELPERHLLENDHAAPGLEVVGVAPDVAPLIPGQIPRPEMYWPNRQHARWATHFLVRTDREAGVVEAEITETLLALDPDLSLGRPFTLASSEARALMKPRFQVLVLLLFALAALALSAGGVYAVVSYSMERRVREIGIRMALGATKGDVLALAMSSNVSVVVGGLVLGLLGALGTAYLLAAMLPDVSPADPLSLGVALLLLMGVATVASFVPARRAARTDPSASMGLD